MNLGDETLGVENLIDNLDGLDTLRSERQKGFGWVQTSSRVSDWANEKVPATSGSDVATQEGRKVGSNHLWAVTTPWEPK